MDYSSPAISDLITLHEAGHLSDEYFKVRMEQEQLKAHMRVERFRQIMRETEGRLS